MKGLADFFITSITDVENEITLQENTALNESQQFAGFDDDFNLSPEDQELMDYVPGLTEEEEEEELLDLNENDDFDLDENDDFDLDEDDDLDLELDEDDDLDLELEEDDNDFLYDTDDVSLFESQKSQQLQQKQQAQQKQQLQQKQQAEQKELQQKQQAA